MQDLVSPSLCVYLPFQYQCFKKSLKKWNDLDSNRCSYGMLQQVALPTLPQCQPPHLLMSLKFRLMFLQNKAPGHP